MSNPPIPAARLRRLETRVARLEAAALVPPDAAAVMARIAATQPVSPEEQAHNRAVLLAAVSTRRTDARAGQSPHDTRREAA